MNSNSNDRLSSLPDDILLNILSLLPANYASRTSSLSKRWRDLFLGVARIDVTRSVQESACLTISQSQASMDTLSSINNVKQLLIAPDYGIRGGFKVHVHSLPQLPNLNHLLFRFEQVPSAMFKDIFWPLIHRAPNLRELTFSMNGYMLPSEIVPPLCFGRNLERINLRGFKGTDAEIAMVEWMLNQAAMLHKIVLDDKQSGDAVEYINLLTKMAQLHPKCEIVINY